ncbi:hypothetical protein niasHS_014493 [Heterodera schachtii]|uniref:Uncharacterized protein n=1 Tax=Heterodera schachtii TaxID=97005 RepID=A0ABD2I8A8_HETSC
MARETGTSTPAFVAGHEAAHSVAVINLKHMPQKDCSIAELEALLIADMAGRAVELLLIGKSHGDEGDVEEATVNARELLKMRGRRKERGRERERRALKIAIREVIAEATDAAKVFIEANWNAFEKFATVLHERKTISADEAEE